MRVWTKQLICLSLVLVLVGPGFAPGFASAVAGQQDTQSSDLNAYLHSHKLPLVQALISADEFGKKVVLYGYTATDLGKQHASERVGEFLKDTSVQVDNRIQVRPELANLKPKRKQTKRYATEEPAPPTEDGAASPSANPGLSGRDDYARQQQQEQQQYLQQSQPGAPSDLMTLLMMGALMGFGISGGSSSFSLHSSPYGYSSPYSSPYGSSSPYGYSPYGSSPYGSSPYGSSPYGSSPYGSSPYGSSPYGSSPYGSSPYGSYYGSSPYSRPGYGGSSPYGYSYP